MTLMDTLKSIVKIMLVMAWSMYMFAARMLESSLYLVHDITMFFMRIMTLNQVPVFASRAYYEPAQTRYIVVTGTSSGIGNHCALYLARMGYSVIATVRKEKDIQDWNQVQRSSRDMQGKIIPIIMDLQDPKSIYDAATKVRQILRESNGTLVGLVNNAGISGPFSPFEMIDLNKELDVMTVNWRGTLICTQQFLPMLRESKGRILVLSSILGRFHLPYFSPYCMSKSALEAFCDSLRLEMVNHGVSVSIIEPGCVDIKLMGKLQGEIDNCSDRVNKSKVYGSDYQKAVKSQQILTNLPFNTVDLTTKAIVHAMTSSSPQSRYAVGLDAKAIRLMQNVLPDSVMDIGMKIFV